MRSVLGALGYLAHESRPDLSGTVSILQSRFNEPRCLAYKKQTEWSDCPRLIQTSYYPNAKFLWIRTALCLMEMPVVEVPVLNKHEMGI